MKYKNDIEFTYLDYLYSSLYKNESADQSLLNPMLAQFNTFSASYPVDCPVFVIIDYINKEYIFMTDNTKRLYGYHSKEFLENGLEFYRSLQQKDFFQVYNNNFFPNVLAFLKNTDQAQHKDYVFSFTTRFKNKMGDWVEILQKCSYITSSQTGLPLYCLGMASDISLIKRDNLVFNCIERIDAVTGNKLTVDVQYYYAHEEDKILSTREKRILSLMADGLSSKQIAPQLNISENTISNHRQNMLRKTETKNVAELIAFAIRNRII